MATYEMTYTGTSIWDDSREFPFTDVAIPGTYNAIEISYTGTIKAGFQISQITISLDDEASIIRVRLPAVEVLSNDLYIESSHETRSLFNRLPDDVLVTVQTEAEAWGLSEAEQSGLYELAEAHAKNLIIKALTGFSDYTVVFY